MHNHWHVQQGEEHFSRAFLFFISGTPEDRVLASSIAALLCVQLGAGPESQDVFKTLKPHLITVIQDKTASSAARSNVRISRDQLLFCNDDIRWKVMCLILCHQHFSILKWWDGKTEENLFPSWALLLSSVVHLGG